MFSASAELSTLKSCVMHELDNLSGVKFLWL